MEETLGKRIASHRKRLNLTQDALAEQLGVTAQAISKWENDQSCPDISMLPKLAEIFSTTTDALLGVKTAVSDPEPETAAGEPIPNVLWTSRWKLRVGIALWLLLAGGLLTLEALLHWDVAPRYITWTSGLLIFGLLGLYPRFSMVRLGCALFGGYWLFWYIGWLPQALAVTKWEFVIPSALLLFGACLLLDTLKNPRKEPPMCHRLNGSSESRCTYGGERFDCVTVFGGDDRQIQLARLSGGQAKVAFGDLTIDLTACAEIMDGCRLDLACAFGHLEIILPRNYRAEYTSGNFFGVIDTKGAPAPDTIATVNLACKVSFGEICIRQL